MNPISFGPIASMVQWLFAALSTVLIALCAVTVCAPGKTSWKSIGGVVFLFVAASAAACRGSFDGLALIGAAAITGLLTLSIQRSLLEGTLIDSIDCSVLAWPLVAAGCASSVIGLLQYFGQSVLLAPFASWAPAGEAYGNLRQRNQLASLTNMALAVLVLWRCRSRLRGGSDVEIRKNGLVAGAISMVVAANAATASRTGLVQLIMLGVVAMIWFPQRRSRGLVCQVSVTYVVCMWSFPILVGLDPSLHGMFARLREGDALCSSRLTLWSNVLHLIANRPWLGWGWGELDYAHFITVYDGPRFCDILDNAHNLPLHLAVELGVPFAVTFCAGLALWVWRSKPWRETNSMRQLAWMVIMIIGIHSMLEYPLWYAPFQIALGLSLGLLVKPSDQPAVVQETNASWWSRLTPSVALAVALFVASMYAAWDYRRINQIYLDPMTRAPEYRYDTLTKIQDSWLFRRQVQFAELTTSRLTSQNAERIHALASELLHFSPEPRVVEKLISSAQLLGREDEAVFFLQRYQAAFPDAYDKWMERRGARDQAGD